MLPVDKLYVGDCLDLFPSVDDDSVNLVVTSPPYNLGIEYDKYKDEIPWPEYYRWSRKWMKEVYRVLKPDGRFCINHYFSCGWVGHRSAPLQNLGCIAEEDIGFKHHGVAWWDDRTLTKYTAWGSYMSASAPYCNSPYEGILILYKDHWKRDTKGKSTITKEEFIESCLGIWKIPTERTRVNPAPFPVALPRRCINLLTYEEDLVLDPFMGSGSTAVASVQTGRHYIGFELSEDYCKLAEERIRRRA